ncbi:MAG: peptidoglycan hydrolase RipC [Mycobacterium sp.]
MNSQVFPLRFRVVIHRLLCALIGASVLFSFIAANVSADPAADALARLNEVSRQAEQTTEQIHSAQIDLDNKLVAQQAADRTHAADRAAADTAKVELARYQTAVDEVAAATYMGGSGDGLAALLSAPSPQQLIEQLAIQKTVSAEMAERISAFRSANSRAARLAEDSARSAAQAKAAADQAASVQAELLARQAQLQDQIAAVKAQYEALSPDQRAVLADIGPPPPPVPPAAPTPDPAIVAMPQPSPLEPTGNGGAVVQAALTRIGSPYSWGATGPNAFDCSGLIKWAFLQNGKSLPRSSQALAEGGQPVAVSNLQPGDIVTFYADVSHAGIYIGDGMMVHASTFGTPVKVAPISSAPIHNARRY